MQKIYIHMKINPIPIWLLWFRAKTMSQIKWKQQGDAKMTFTWQECPYFYKKGRWENKIQIVPN